MNAIVETAADLFSHTLSFFDPAQEYDPVSDAVNFLRLEKQNQAMRHLLKVVQELSLARNLESIMAIVRRSAREMTQSDGATFVLRDGDKCFYADEDAIEPLWKGQRFPISLCISGWAMTHRQPVQIEDVYNDSRIPVLAYRPTFIKSLVMVPIRTMSPIGAIGNYWAHHHRATVEEIETLQALANTTAVAMENVQLYSELEQRVRDRTERLEVANRDLEAFSYTVCHDLKSPLFSISGSAELLGDLAQQRLDPKEQQTLITIQSEARRMDSIIQDLLRLAKISKKALVWGKVSLNDLAQPILDRLQRSAPERLCEFEIEPELEIEGDAGLLRVVLENLLGNSWKYSAKSSFTKIELGRLASSTEEPIFFVRDNGAGFDMQYADKLFTPFQRLHTEKEFQGTGVGLATVHRIILQHRGELWAESAPGKGACFFFKLPSLKSDGFNYSRLSEEIQQL